MKCRVEKIVPCLVFAFFILADLAAWSAPAGPEFASQKAEPDITYGKNEGAPLPKTILFSVGPDAIIADAEEWSKRGVNAFFLDFVAREWSNDIWAADGKPWTIGESDEMLQKCRKANEVCKKIGSEAFLKFSYDHPFEWFNDIAWQRIDNNFRQFAIFAREAGCPGLAIDIEYIGDQYMFDWPGYDYKGYTRKDLIEKIRARMTRVMSIMYDEFPNMIFLTFPEEGFSLGSVIHAAWIEEAARRNAPGGIHYCTEGTYRNPNVRYMLGHAWECNQFFQKLLSDKARKYWVEKCSIAEGIWPFGYDNQTTHDPGLALPEFRQGYAAALMASRRYMWIYSHISADLLIGRKTEKWTSDTPLADYLKVIANREVITTPKYVELARDIREMKERDYSKDLGLVPVPLFAGPADTISLSLMPGSLVNRDEAKVSWDLALKYFHGEEIDLHKHFQTQTHWMVVGPFPNAGKFEGHNKAYPPEQKVDLAVEYDGVGEKEGTTAKLRWAEYTGDGKLATVDFTKVFKPTEHVCAYAFGYVTAPSERKVQIRFASNDSGKLWLGKDLIFDYPHEGTAVLDRDIITVTLPEGKAPILIKICNGVAKWGFVFRITELDGRPAEGLKFSVN